MVDDIDPGSPGDAGDLNASDFELAKNRANFGDLTPEDYERQSRDQPAPFAEAGPMPLEIEKAQAFLDACIEAGVSYGLGAKVPFFRAVPGQDFTAVDCSGFVREAIRQATERAVRFPDGSVVQHDWIKAEGYPVSSVQAAKAQDNKVRIAFWPPQRSPTGIGHVVLVYNARTLESHGGTGPDSRPWTGQAWQGQTNVYELT